MLLESNNYAVFNLALLRNYQLVNVPGTYTVSCAYTVHACDMYVGDEYPRYLIPLRVLTSHSLSKIVDILERSDMTTIPFSVIRNLFLTGAIFDNDLIDITTLPIKGEKLLATFDKVDGELLCTHIELLPREELEFINPDDYDKYKQLLKGCIEDSE